MSSPARRAELANNLTLLHCGAEVVGLLASHDIDVVLLKGMALLDDVYRVDERTMSDVDLLVRPRDFEAAHRVLIGAGLRLYEERRRPRTTLRFHQRAYFHPRGCNIDLHRHFDEPGRWRIAVDELFARAERHTLQGIATWRLCDIDTVLHLCIHLTKEELGSLTWSVRDIARLLGRRSIDWETLVVRAGAWQCRTAAWLALRLACNVYGATVPQRVLRSLRPQALRRAYLAVWLSSQQDPAFRFLHWRRRRQLLLRAALLDTVGQRLADVAGVLGSRLADCYTRSVDAT
ncbi:MAG: nucleotidyltransferase family protein [Myxococcota bacterium]